MIITWVNAQEKAAGMSRLADRVGTHHAHDWAEGVATAGERTIADIARVDTGWMESSVGKRASAMGGVGVAEAGYGVIKAHPFYTKFQEYGTRHGIMPMHSILAGSQAMEIAAQDEGMRTLSRIAAEWNAI